MIKTRISRIEEKSIVTSKNGFAVTADHALGSKDRDLPPI
jgi:hypothetical protein